MTLQEIFQQLSVGEFSQLRLGEQEQGVINADNAKTVVHHINLGLTALHARFLLRQGELALKLLPGQYSYVLDNKYAVANKRSLEPMPSRFILDSVAQPFLNDIHKIEEVFTPAKVPVPLNQLSDRYSCVTPNMRALVVPEEIVDQAQDLPAEYKTDTLRVKYRANHPIISLPVGLFNPKQVQVDLPASHLEALLFYVASRVHNPIGMQNEFHAGNSYAMKYEAACQLLENKGLQINTGGDLSRFERNGFV